MGSHTAVYPHTALNVVQLRREKGVKMQRVFKIKLKIKN
jgi:hypothetical protein